MGIIGFIFWRLGRQGLKGFGFRAFGGLGVRVRFTNFGTLTAEDLGFEVFLLAVQG